MLSSSINKTTVVVPVSNIELKGDLTIPFHANSIVLFAHGSGSSRLSPRNQMVAKYLNEQGFATFLFDLMTYEEDRDYNNRFNISLLAQRLRHTTNWIAKHEQCKSFRIGYFGTSTGAAAALIAARDVPQVLAVVSRGGRPDLAMKYLPDVKAATLLIVGSLDTDVLRLNSRAFMQLNCQKKLEIIAGARHLFDEEGAMERVCVLAANWFQLHLQPLELFN